MVSQILTQPFQRRSVVKELIDPGLATQGEPTYNSTMVFENHEDLFTFVNVDSFTEREYDVSFLQTNQGPDLTIGKDKIFTECQVQTGKSCLISTQPYYLYESQKTFTYDTISESYAGSDYLKINFSPCIEDLIVANGTVMANGTVLVNGTILVDGVVVAEDGTVTTVVDKTIVSTETMVTQCSDRADVYKLLTSHELRIRYKQLDENENAYWMETPLPPMGKAMSIFIREVTTINEDYHYLFGYPLLSYFMEFNEAPGVTTNFVIGNIVNGHQPTTTEQ